MRAGQEPQSAVQTTATGRRRGLQERVGAAIVESAARVLATHGERANMNDVAVEAGIARATLYRYFSSRAELLEAVAAVAAAEAEQRLAAARLDELEVREAVVRAVRALLEVGDPLVALARESVRPQTGQLGTAVHDPLRRLIERGQAGGRLRDDAPAGWLAEMLLALVASALAARPALGREDAVAAIASLFLDGAHTRPSAAPV